MGNSNFTPRQLLNRAIGKEAEARMMYEIYAEKIEDPRGKKLLEDLAKEELGHKEALEKVDPDDPGTFKTPEISSAEFHDFSDRPQIAKDSTMQEVLRYAIGEEQDAFSFYDSLSGHAADENLLNLLRRLASEEKRHKEKLERMYDEMVQPEN